VKSMKSMIFHPHYFCLAPAHSLNGEVVSPL